MNLKLHTRSKRQLTSENFRDPDSFKFWPVLKKKNINPYWFLHRGLHLHLRGFFHTYAQAGNLSCSLIHQLLLVIFHCLQGHFPAGFLSSSPSFWVCLYWKIHWNNQWCCQQRSLAVRPMILPESLAIKVQWNLSNSQISDPDLGGSNALVVFQELSFQALPDVLHAALRQLGQDPTVQRATPGRNALCTLGLRVWRLPRETWSV